MRGEGFFCACGPFSFFYFFILWLKPSAREYDDFVCSCGEGFLFACCPFSFLFFPFFFCG